MTRSLLLVAVGVALGAGSGLPFGLWLGRRSAPAPEAAAAPPARPVEASPTPATGPAKPEDRPPARNPFANPGSAGRREPAPPAPFANDPEAVALLSSDDPDEVDRAARHLRERLLRASPRDWTTLDRLIASAVALRPAEERARLLRRMFRTGGFRLIDDEPGPPLLEGSLRTLFLRTVRELPSGDAHADLLDTLATQVAQERGAHVFESFAFVHLTLSAEKARLESPSSTPLAAEASSLLASELERVAGFTNESAKFGEAAGLYALGGPKSTEADRAVLLRHSREHTSPHVRKLALLSLASAQDAPEVNPALADAAADARRPTGERLIAWWCLRKRGREDLLPAEVRGQILKGWEEAGGEGAATFLE